MNSHKCFHSIYMMRVPDRAARLRVATLELTPHSFTHLSALLHLFVQTVSHFHHSNSYLFPLLPQEDILIFYKPSLCLSVMCLFSWYPYS